MTNTQLYLAIGLPCISVMAALIVSLVQISGIRGEMKTSHDDLREDMRTMREDMRTMREDFRTELRAFREDFRSVAIKIDLLTGKVAEIDTRLAVLEERMSK